MGFPGLCGRVFIGKIPAGIGKMAKNGGYMGGWANWGGSAWIFFVKFFVGWDWCWACVGPVGLCIVGCWGRLGRVARAGVAGVVVVMCSAGYGAGAMVGAGWYFSGARVSAGGVATVSFG